MFVILFVVRCALLLFVGGLLLYVVWYVLCGEVRCVVFGLRYALFLSLLCVVFFGVECGLWFVDYVVLLVVCSFVVCCSVVVRCRLLL